MKSLHWRPSKTFFYRRFQEFIDRIPAGIRLLDAACADLAHYRFLKKFDYVGVDLNADRIKRGIRKNPSFDGNTIVSTLQDLDVPKKSFDCIVSTHTLCWLPVDERIPVLDHLRSFLRDDGSLFATLPSANQTETLKVQEWLEDSFDESKVVPYRRPITNYYENALQWGVCVPGIGRLIQFGGTFASIVLAPLDAWPRFGQRNDLIIEGSGK